MLITQKSLHVCYNVEVNLKIGPKVKNAIYISHAKHSREDVHISAM